MPKMLYVELFGEELRPDPKSPTGYERVMAGNGKCAVFDEEELDSLIQKTKSRFQSLKSLRKTAEAHSSIMAEEYLKALEVPYKVHTLNTKKC